MRVHLRGYIYIYIYIHNVCFFYRGTGHDPLFTHPSMDKEEPPVAATQEDEEGSVKIKVRWTENEDRLLRLITQVGWW